MRLIRPVAITLGILLTVTTGVALATQNDKPAGVIGPQNHTLPDGRKLHPAGRVTRVGNFPTGGALTLRKKYYWTVSTGRGLNDIRIVRLKDGKVIQKLPIPGASGGIAMHPKKPIAYVSGVADSEHLDQDRPRLPGREGDKVWVFSYNRATGKAKFRRLIDVPPPSNTAPPQNFPPTNTEAIAWPDRLAASPDGRTLLVPLNLADSAAIVDTASGSVQYVAVGRFPYGAAILRDGRTGLVSNETDGTVSVIDLTDASVTTTVQVGPALSHPEAIVVDPKAPRAYVSVTNSDQVAVIDTRTFEVAQMLSVDHGSGLGVAPVGLTMTPDGKRLYVAEQGTDSIAVFAKRGKGGKLRLIGRIPTGKMPMDVAATKRKVVYLDAKGLGVGPNPDGPVPTSPENSDDGINAFDYLPSIVRGSVGVLKTPKGKKLKRLTRRADRSLIPSNRTKPPANTPLRPNGPIKHVFYIVRENRTYDQVLGDDPRGDGDPKLTLFGPKVTPNIHALVKRFPLLDHVYANSEASIDGHFWTSAGSVSDYVQKNWYQNYGGRKRPYDFVYAATWPSTGFLFDQAQDEGISWFNYGEAIAGVLPLPDQDRTAAMTADVVAKFAKSDLGAGVPSGLGGLPGGQCYPNDADIEHNVVTMAQTYDGSPPGDADPNAESRFDCFEARFTQQVLTDSVPAFNYLVLPNDHTVGTSPGKRTPQALMADNDYGLGQVVDLISHSDIWESSAIFVIEDDSQDGADHVDAHRIPAAVISPYAKPGAVISTRYDFLSVIRSMELILGMEPLGLFDRLATPMYDVFSPSIVNAAPYTAIVPTQDRSALNTATSPGAARSAELDFSFPDLVPQDQLDAILWQSVHGADSTPPPPGPNASGKDGRGDRDEEDELSDYGDGGASSYVDDD